MFQCLGVDTYLHSWLFLFSDQNGDGYLDQWEVEALFQNEVRKADKGLCGGVQAAFDSLESCAVSPYLEAPFCSKIECHKEVRGVQ